MNILHVDDDPLMRDLVALTVRKTFSIEVQQAGSGQEVIQYLQDGQSYDLIISDYNMPNGTGGDLLKHIQQQNLQIPFVLMSSDHPSQHPEFENYHLDGHILKPNVQAPLKQLLSEIIPVEVAAKKILGDQYITVSSHSLNLVGQLPFDIYLKLGPKKYIRILKKTAMFSREFAERYEKRGVTGFYIKSTDADLLITYLSESIEALSDLQNSHDITQDIQKILPNIEDEKIKSQLEGVVTALNNLEKSTLTNEDTIRISDATHKATQKAMRRLGASLEVQTLVKASVKLVLETLAQMPELGEQARRLIEDKDNYLSTHTLLAAQVSCLLAHRLGWSSHLTRYKLVLASFLHDITLENANLAKISTLQELEDKKANFTKSELVEFKEHPIVVASMIKDFEQIPPDVHTIVYQHHEQPDGSGFPNKLAGGQILPLSALFIVAHDLTGYLMSQNSHLNVSERFFQLRQKKYSKMPFKQILDKVHDPLS